MARTSGSAGIDRTLTDQVSDLSPTSPASLHATQTRPPLPTPGLPVSFEIAEQIKAAAVGHCDRRQREMLTEGSSDEEALQCATDESIQYARQLVQDACRRAAIHAVTSAYGDDTYGLLRDLADHLGLSLAYVDRATVQAHLERPLSENEWAATRAQFHAMDFDDHVGDHGSFRTDWIETVLERAGMVGADAGRDDQPLSHTTIGTAAP